MTIYPNLTALQPERHTTVRGAQGENDGGAAFVAPSSV
jgi:hypothetical protein